MLKSIEFFFFIFFFLIFFFLFLFYCKNPLLKTIFIKNKFKIIKNQLKNIQNSFFYYIIKNLKLEFDIYIKFSFLFIILLIINLYGLLPYSWCYNTIPNNTLLLTIIIFILTNIILFKNIYFSLKNSFKNISYIIINFFPNGTPLWLAILIIPVEIISYFIRPFSMGLRIAGNLIAGHILMGLIINLIFLLTLILNNFYIKIIIIPIINSIYMILFFMEICVAFIQAYVLTLLSSTFLKETEELH